MLRCCSFYAAVRSACFCVFVLISEPLMCPHRSTAWSSSKLSTICGITHCPHRSVDPTTYFLDHLGFARLSLLRLVFSVYTRVSTKKAQTLLRRSLMFDIWNLTWAGFLSALVINDLRGDQDCADRLRFEGPAFRLNVSVVQAPS